MMFHSRHSLHRLNAHPHIYAIAAYSQALAGPQDASALRVADFLEAFRFDPPGAALFHKGARRIGMA